MYNQEVSVSTPGRICLFGEHQDYLNLPVIAAAISLRLNIRGTLNSGNSVRIELPDIGSTETINLRGDLAYISGRDYFRSGIKVMQRHGFTFRNGFDCTVHGTIPINAGTSSSTALVVSWVHFLALMSDQRALLSPMQCARIGHEVEVTEFNEPGGMMDHYSTALGGVLKIDFAPQIAVTRASLSAVSIVLGNSGEPKDTKKILANVKDKMLGIASQLGTGNSDTSLQSLTAKTVQRLKSKLAPQDYSLLNATVENHEITLEAGRLLAKPGKSMNSIGMLINRHQDNLRDVLGISTPKIDRMISAALKAGAVGAKINGSGGGGCMFALAPNFAERVAEAIEREGGAAYIVSVDTGTKIESGVYL